MNQEINTDNRPVYVAIPNTTKAKMEAIIAVCSTIGELARAVSKAVDAIGSFNVSVEVNGDITCHGGYGVSIAPADPSVDVDELKP